MSHFSEKISKFQELICLPPAGTVYFRLFLINKMRVIHCRTVLFMGLYEIDELESQPRRANFKHFLQCIHLLAASKILLKFSF